MEGMQMGALWRRLRIAFLAGTAMADIFCALIKKKRCYIETSSLYFGAQICVHFSKKYMKYALLGIFMYVDFCLSF